MKIKIKVYHGTTLQGAQGIIESGFNNEMNCATPCKKYALKYADPYLLSFKFTYDVSVTKAYWFIKYLLFNRFILTTMVNEYKPSKITVVKIK